MLRRKAEFDVLLFVNQYIPLEGYKIIVKKKVKLSLLQAVEAHRVVRGQGSHIFYTIDTDGSKV
jgi:hypothetical protein